MHSADGPRRLQVEQQRSLCSLTVDVRQAKADQDNSAYVYSVELVR